MNKFVLGFALMSLAAPTFAAPPTEASIEKLLEVSRSRAMIDSLQGPIEQNIRASAALATRGKQLTAEQRQKMDDAMARAAAVIRSELTYEKFKPIYMKIYAESLDQAEVDGMIAFYQTPAGQAVLSKMPLIAQKSMDSIREMMGTLMPRLEAALKEAAQSSGGSQ